MHHSNIKQAHILTHWPPVLFEDACFAPVLFEYAGFAPVLFEYAGFEGAGLQTYIKWQILYLRKFHITQSWLQHSTEVEGMICTEAYRMTFL